VTARPDFSTRRRRRAPAPGDVGLLGVGLMTLALAGYATTSSWAALRRVRRDVAETRREASEAGARLQALETRREPGQGLTAQAIVSAEAPPPRVIADLAALMPADVRLEALILDYRERLGVELQVAARNAASYDIFLQNLESSPMFTDVLPGDETRGPELRASVRATYHSEPVR